MGIHNRGNGLTVNPLRVKLLTNIRTVIKDDNVLLAAPLIMTLEQSLEFIQDDELVDDSSFCISAVLFAFSN